MKINIPNFKQSDMIDACINGIQGNERKNRIVENKEYIVEQSELYNQYAETRIFSDFPIPNNEINLFKEDMLYLYNNRLVNSKAGRHYYNLIKSNVLYSICPICGIGKISTIDHYLPESIYYQLSITKNNLIPCCSDCNKNKSNYKPTKREEETIHPYFDDFDDEVWLKARIILNSGRPFVFKYYVDKPEEWTSIKYKRALNHFRIFKLNEPYSNLATIECEKKTRMAIMMCSNKKLNISLIKELYLEELEQENNNSWKKAMLQCMVDSEEYWEYIDSNSSINN